MILAATACGKSSAKQANGADSLKAFVEAMQQSDSGKVARPALVVPNDLVAFAIAATNKHECKGFEPPCKNYAVDANNSQHLQLTAADRANGYEDTWCVTTTFLRKFAREPWASGSNHSFYEKHGGAWHVGGEMMCYGNG
jgi:hypothetical protein